MTRADRPDCFCTLVGSRRVAPVFVASYLAIAAFCFVGCTDSFERAVVARQEAHQAHTALRRSHGGFAASRWTFRKYAKRSFGVHFDRRWFLAQARVESGLDQRARGVRGARGIMQILPATFGELNAAWLEDAHRPAWHIAVGIAYDRLLYDGAPPSFSPYDRIAWMLAAYNCGGGCVRRAWLRCGRCSAWPELAVQLPAITSAYVEKIRALHLKLLYSHFL